LLVHTLEVEANPPKSNVAFSVANSTTEFDFLILLFDLSRILFINLMGFFSFIRRLILILFGTANDLVFLSFSNEDTGKNFSDHLNSALTYAGLRTFKNDDGVRRGENTGSETRKAIQESKISVIVFSKDYASSTRCLDELVMIMDARRATGHIVLPIFYHLDPSEVWSQEGRYFEAFSAHEKSFQGEMGRVEEWRAALREAADVAGMVLQDRYITFLLCFQLILVHHIPSLFSLE
jgi:hypothetical protein